MKRIKQPPHPPNSLTLEQLRYFLAAARSGNFTRAAEESFLSQSAFSRQIQALEDGMGVPLFDRIGRKVRLSSAGEALETRAAEILARVDRLPSEIGPAGKGLKGTIRLGSYISYGIRLLPAWLAGFAQRFPDVFVNLLLRTNTEMEGLLRNETIEAALMDEPDVRRSGSPPLALKIHLTYDDELWVVGPKGIDPDTIPPPNARWFGVSDPVRRSKLARMGFIISDPTRVPGGEVALKFIEAGLGYTVLPSFMARSSRKAGRITKLSSTLTRQVAFVTPASRSISPCVEQLINFLRPKWKAESERQQRDAAVEREQLEAKRKRKKRGKR